MTVDELLGRISAQELAEWQYLLGKEHELTKAVRDGVDPDVAADILFTRKDD